jgi:translation initiation factor IF-3
LKKPYINYQIRAKQVRLIDETGKQLGVLELEEAINIAKEKNLDLIQVTEKADPPVVKIMDYGKYLYQQQKKEKNAAHQKKGGLKTIRLTFGISDHDMETRARQAEKFLKIGDIVRIEMRLRGREKALKTFSKEKMEKFIEILKKTIPIKIENPLRKEPRGLTMIISYDKKSDIKQKTSE